MYDYREAICEDIKNVLEYYPKQQHESLEHYKERLYDELFLDDSVTGNASGSYTFSTYDAEENLCHNTGLLHEALYEFGYDMKDVADKSAEWCDVIIRCYLLGECIEEVVDAIDFDEEEEDK